MLINIRVIIFAAKNGAAPLNIVPIPRPEIADPTLIQVPTGGVTAPTAKPVINIAPNWIGDIPTATQAGKNTGVNNRIAGLTSIKVPAIRITTTIKSNMMTGEKFIVIINVAMVCGTRSSARIQMYNFEKAITIMIFALVRIAELRQSGIVFVKYFLNPLIPRNIKPTQKA